MSAGPGEQAKIGVSILTLPFISIMRFICNQKAAVFWLFFMFLPNKSHAKQSISTSSNFHGDLSLIWINRNNKPKIGLIHNNVLLEPHLEADTSAASMGLKKARFVWDWSQGKRNGLTLVFRPDALSQPQPYENPKQRYEPDYRAGDVVDSSPTIEFLDAYQIHLSPFSALSVSLGVFENLAKSAGTYCTDLPFGLKILPVSKTFALLFSWAPEGGKNKSFDVDIAVYQGSNERGEQPPSAMDPPSTLSATRNDQKNGGLLATQFQLNPDSEVSFTSSYHESKLNEFFDTSRAYFQVGLNQKINIKDHSILLSGDARYTVDRFDKKTQSLPTSTASSENAQLKTKPAPERLHRSLEFGGLFEIVPEFYLLGGLVYGEAMLDPIRIGQVTPQDDEVKAKGHQYELGLRASSNQGASIQVAYAQEIRHSEDSLGQKSGGFKNKDGSYRNSISRVAVNVSYIFDSRL